MREHREDEDKRKGGPRQNDVGKSEGCDRRRICDSSDLSLILLPINLSRLSNTLRPGYCPPFFLRLSSAFPLSSLSCSLNYDAEKEIYSLSLNWDEFVQ